MEKLLMTLAVIAMAYGAFSVFLYFVQDSLIFYPNASRIAIDESAVERFEMSVDPDDEVKTVCYVVNGDSKGPLVVFFAGNGTEARGYADEFRSFHATSVLTNYRGYGGSDGKPTEEAILADAKFLVNWARERFPDKPLVLMGFSLGTGVAMLTANPNVDGLVLISPYRSLVDVANQNFVFRLFPIRLLMKHPFDTRSKHGELPSKVLALYSPDDRQIPPQESRKLLEHLPQAEVREFSGPHSAWLYDGEHLDAINTWLSDNFGED